MVVTACICLVTLQAHLTVGYKGKLNLGCTPYSDTCTDASYYGGKLIKSD